MMTRLCRWISTLLRALPKAWRWMTPYLRSFYSMFVRKHHYMTDSSLNPRPSPGRSFNDSGMSSRVKQELPCPATRNSFDAEKALHGLSSVTHISHSLLPLELAGGANDMSLASRPEKYSLQVDDHSMSAAISISPNSLIPSSPPPGLSVFEPNLYPISVAQFRRYERNVVKPRVYNDVYNIKPLTTSYNQNIAPLGWNSLSHPEGAMYFCDEKRSIYTDANLFDPNIHSALEYFIQQIDIYIKTYNISLQGKPDLVLDLTCSGTNDYICGYYYADHRDRCLFWLDVYNAIGLLDEVKVHLSLPHVGHEIESQYWHHNELFPNAFEVTVDLIHHLKDIIVHAIGDSLTSSVSTAPYAINELEKMLLLVNTMTDPGRGQFRGSACIIYRFLGTFAHERFLNLHGQQGARLCRDQSIHGGSTINSSLMRCLSPILLFSPNQILDKFERVSNDQLVNRSSWARIHEQLKSEWKDSMLHAMICLNVNVAFLALPGTNIGVGPMGHYAIQLSIVFNITAIITGLALQRHSETTVNASFLVNKSVSHSKLEMLAIVYSLPSALFVWGIASFMTAFGFVFLASF